jgi:cytoskeletal protein CcmA (bactofilin family)
LGSGASAVGIRTTVRPFALFSHVGTQRIEIRTSAKVTGNLSSPVLVIQEGALFEGHCSMQPEGARDDRKVTVFPKEERVAPKEERIAQAASGGQKQA